MHWLNILTQSACRTYQLVRTAAGVDGPWSKRTLPERVTKGDLPIRHR